MYITDQLYLHGGVEKMLTSKINYWIQRFEYEVYLVTGEQRGHPFVYKLDSRVKHIDLNINYLRDISYFSPKNLRKTVSNIARLKNVINDIKPDVIISPSFSPDQYVLPFIFKKIPKIKEIHFSGHILQNMNGVFSPKALMERFFPYYDRVVVLNKDEKKYYPTFKTSVIPNFTENVAVEDFRLRENVVVAAGRYASVKQFDHLIKAWSLISEKFPGWKLRIFGGGNARLKQYYEDLIGDLHVVHSVELPGATTELTLEMQKSKIYAMTSKTECFPMVLLEAQTAGLPVVSYDCPNGPRNIISNYKTGLLVEDQNIPKFADTLANLMLNDNFILKMGDAGRKNAENYYPKPIMEMWDSLLKKVIDEKKN